MNPMLVGRLWDVAFEGQSSIIDQEGYAAGAKSHTEEEILSERPRRLRSLPEGLRTWWRRGCI